MTSASRRPVNSATALAAKSVPITEATSSTRRSAGFRRSKRDASSAWMVGGTSMSAASTVRRQPSGLGASTPSCTSMPTNSRTNSGLPPVEVGSRRSSSSGNRSLPSTRPANSAVAPASSPRSRTASVTQPPTVTRSGRVSRSSGRASAIIRTGAPRTHSARCSMKSSSRLSAHWMSSKISTSGSPAASTSTKRRSAQNVSSTEPGTPDVMPVRSRSMRSRSVVPAGISASRSRGRNTSTIGASAGLPSTAQRTSSTRAPGRDRANSAASRVLPTPGSPVTVTRRAPRAATAFSKTLRSRCNSSPRPTKVIDSAAAEPSH